MDSTPQRSKRARTRAYSGVRAGKNTLFNAAELSRLGSSKLDVWLESNGATLEVDNRGATKYIKARVEGRIEDAVDVMSSASNSVLSCLGAFSARFDIECIVNDMAIVMDRAVWDEHAAWGAINARFIEGNPIGTRVTFETIIRTTTKITALSKDLAECMVRVGTNVAIVVYC